MNVDTFMMGIAIMIRARPVLTAQSVISALIQAMTIYSDVFSLSGVSIFLAAGTPNKLKRILKVSCVLFDIRVIFLESNSERIYRSIGTTKLSRYDVAKSRF